MSRRTIMTVGFLLIFVGIQFHLVTTFTLSRRVTKFLVENFEDPVQLVKTANGVNNNSPFSQASYNNGYTNTQPTVPVVVVKGRQITHPNWLCWPFIFVGAVFVLHGMALRRE